MIEGCFSLTIRKWGSRQKPADAGDKSAIGASDERINRRGIWRLFAEKKAG
jgi:hypothetical protein